MNRRGYLFLYYIFQPFSPGERAEYEDKKDCHIRKINEKFEIALEPS